MPTTAANLTPTKKRKTSGPYSPAVSPARVRKRSSEELKIDDLEYESLRKQREVILATTKRTGCRPSLWIGETTGGDTQGTTSPVLIWYSPSLLPTSCYLLSDALFLGFYTGLSARVHTTRGRNGPGSKAPAFCSFFSLYNVFI